MSCPNPASLLFVFMAGRVDCLHRAAAIGKLQWLYNCLDAGSLYHIRYLNLGGDPNSPNASGCTALELAILHNHTLCVYVLLAAKANPFQRNCLV
jgi:ankyrin repeat protein